MAAGGRAKGVGNGGGAACGIHRRHPPPQRRVRSAGRRATDMAAASRRCSGAGLRRAVAGEAAAFPLPLPPPHWESWRGRAAAAPFSTSACLPALSRRPSAAGVSMLLPFGPAARRRQNEWGNRRRMLLTAPAQETVASWLGRLQVLSSLEAEEGGLVSLVGGGGAAEPGSRDTLSVECSGTSSGCGVSCSLLAFAGKRLANRENQVILRRKRTARSTSNSTSKAQPTPYPTRQ